MDEKTDEEMKNSMIIKTEEDIPTHKPLMFMGKDLLEIKCFRKSGLCGIFTGVSAWLLCFLNTSKVQFSTHVSFASIWVGFFAYWIPCRYKYYKDQQAIETMKEKLRKHIENRGIEDPSPVKNNSDFSKQDK